ncbi:MAG: acyltransferase [Nitrospira sp.]|nr:acyltransferase [Nitrospira sp.]
MNYRREIDGLRALAVIPVILFHAGFQTFSGGFIGVDVFFVISGYLITSIIHAEQQAGTFSIIKFYERRARRILPALFLVMAVSIPFAWLWLLPTDIKDFSQSLIAVSVFASNILFWRESGYFKTANELKPLLHTWSLAVEEQFYVLFPLFVLLTWRLGKRWMIGLLIATMFFSLALAQWSAFNKPVAAFFLLPTRGWELLIGAILAFYKSTMKTTTGYVVSRNIIYQAGSAIGLAMILYAVFAFDKNTPFPSLYALVPTIGTALIILFAYPQTAIGALLGYKAFVGIGLISYSAYLWHQPLFAFARHRALVDPGVLVLLLLSLAAILLAYFSWRFVEQPFRKRGSISRGNIIAMSCFLTIVISTIGLYGHYTNGYGFYSNVEVERLDNIQHRMRVNHGLSEVCEDKFTLAAECRTADEPEILLWGDSFAMHLMQGLIASKPDLKIIQMTVSVCGPILDIAPINATYTETWSRDCLQSNDLVYEWIKSNKTLKYAVLSSAFAQYVVKGQTVFMRDGAVKEGSDIAVEYFLETLKKLKEHGIIPVVFSPPPQTGQDIGRCLARANFFSLNQNECDFGIETANQNQRSVIEFLKKVEEGGFKVVFLSDGVCESGKCSAAVGNIFMYRDKGHLGHEGSALLGSKMNFYKQILYR